MRIIQKEPWADGSRPPIQTWEGQTPPEGYAAVPEDMDAGLFEEANGFVELAFGAGGQVTEIAVNTAAREAWQAARPVPEETAPGMADTMLDLLADHEYRLCLLELEGSTGKER